MKAIYLGSIFQREIYGWHLFGGNYQLSIILQDNSLAANCPGANYLRWKLPGRQVFWAELSWDQLSWGQCPGGNCLGVIIWGGSCLGKIIWAAIVLFQYPINPYIYIQKVKNTTNLREFLNTFEESEREYPTFFSKYNFKQPSAFINYAKYSVSSWGTQIWDRVLS